jgi:hypothetical protein
VPNAPPPMTPTFAIFGCWDGCPVSS